MPNKKCSIEVSSTIATYSSCIFQWTLNSNIIIGILYVYISISMYPRWYLRDQYCPPLLKLKFRADHRISGSRGINALQEKKLFSRKVHGREKFTSQPMSRNRELSSNYSPNLNIDFLLRARLKNTTYGYSTLARCSSKAVSITMLPTDFLSDVTEANK